MTKNNAIPQKYRNNVHGALLAVTAIGPLGCFGDIDAIAVSGVWGVMLSGMLRNTNIVLDKEAAKKLALAVITGAGGYYTGCKLATKLFWLIPGGGFFISAGVSTISNVIFTYRFAWVLAKMLEEDRINKNNILSIAGDIAQIMTLGGGINLNGVRDIVALYHKA